MIGLQFLGAAGTVTGSKFVVTAGSHRFMVDCGLFQGERYLRERNWDDLPVDPRSLESLILTHAHLDHTGYLPRLCRDGYRGPIIGTHGTRDLTELVILDSAHLQEEQANYVNRKRLSRHKPAQPLYTMGDAEYTLKRLKAVDYHQEFEVVPGVKGRFSDAGHILGSAWLELTIDGTRLVFSGDLGRTDAPILRDPEPVRQADYLVLESTYGNKLHSEHDPGEGLRQAVRETIERRGVLVIPAFALERAQEVLYMLGELNEAIPVVVDSPMAVKATRYFDRYPQYYDEEAKRAPRLLAYPGLKLCETIAESKSVADLTPPFVVIAASGMAVGGRILHHLARYLPDANNTVLLVGHQARGTRGWRLEQGEEKIKIFGQWVPVKARVQRLEGFSGHADYGQIDVWLSQLERPPRRTFLTHGEPEALEAQRQRLSGRGWDVTVPAHGEEFTL